MSKEEKLVRQLVRATESLAYWSRELLKVNDKLLAPKTKSRTSRPRKETGAAQ